MIGGRSAGLIRSLAWALALLGLISCRRPEGILLRYGFSPGRRLEYLVSMSGSGTVRLSQQGEGGEADSKEFPFSLEGKLRLAMEVLTAADSGEAELAVSYSDFSLTAADRHDGRDLRVVMTDSSIETWDGETILNEVVSGDPEFFLGDLPSRRFRLVMDSRGKVLELEEPGEINRALPYIRFRQFLLASQPEFPPAPVGPGSSWERKLSLSLPQLADRFSPGESYEGLTTYSILPIREGDAPGLVRIGISGHLEGKPEKKPGESPGSLRIYSQETSGEAVFDSVSGELVSARHRTNQKLGFLVLLSRLSDEQGLEMFLELDLEFAMESGEGK